MLTCIFPYHEQKRDTFILINYGRLHAHWAFVVEMHFVNSSTISPILRLLAPMAALTLMATACGSSPDDTPDDDEQASAGVEESSEGNETEAEAEAPEQSSMGAPGILTAECDGRNSGDLGLIVTLFSAEDGSELHKVDFSPPLAEHAESEFLSHGRAAPQSSEISLSDPCGDKPGAYLLERGMLVAAITENVNGNDISGFGVLHESGTFTTLSPDQEVSDFATPINYLHPVADSEGDRILFVEDDGENTTAQSMDLESGEITELGPCDPMQCGKLTALPGLDSAVFDDSSLRDLVPVLDGSALIGSANTQVLHYFELGDQAGDDLIDLMELTKRTDLFADGGPQVNLETHGRIQVIDDNTLLIADNVMSVWEFTAAVFEDYEAENEDTLQYSREPVPATRTLVPEGPRENSHPHVSPDHTEIIFRSEAEASGTKWYRVPVDGSSEPEEFPGLPLQKVIAWQ